MSAPYPASLTAAPSGGAVAWVLNDKGVRNIWVAAPPEYKGRRVSQYTQADGQEIGGIVWSKDASTNGRASPEASANWMVSSPRR